MSLAEMMEMVRRESGVARLQQPLSVGQWVLWLESHPNASLRNVGHGMEFGMRSGRLPNWVREGYDRFFMLNHEVMSNEQMVEAVAMAAMAENNVAAAVRALQQAMGQVVR